MDVVKRTRVLAATAVAMMAIADVADSSSDEEFSGFKPQLIVTPRKLPKSRHYFSLVDEMDDQEFYTHFRLSRGL